MSRSNYDKPFYVDVGTSIAAIRCASNNDVIFEYDYTKCPQVIQFAKDACDRINREVEISRPLRNCDVGTAEEQSDRFDKFCYSHNTCFQCPVKSIYNSHHRQKQLREIIRCEIIWSQMPYEKGETK